VVKAAPTWEIQHLAGLQPVPGSSDHAVLSRSQLVNLSLATASATSLLSVQW
jgi:hypothetical protein